MDIISCNHVTILQKTKTGESAHLPVVSPASFINSIWATKFRVSVSFIGEQAPR